MIKNNRFSWRCYDLNSELPTGWQGELLNISKKAIAKTLVPTSITSRESKLVTRIPVLTVNGVDLRKEAPWLYELYHGLFRDLAQLESNETVVAASQDIYGAVLNVQRGTDMRYECHVDSNPIEGLLYVTDHPKGAGGELVIANLPDAKSMDEVENNHSVIYPVVGNLVFFDGRDRAHYVRSLVGDNNSERVIVAMNYYTESCPESSRPADLSAHLFGLPV
jgi:hypothetical protein